MKLFRKPQSPQQLHPLRTTLERIYQEQGIPAEMIDEHLQRLPIIRYYVCPSRCGPMILLGEISPPACQTCGKQMTEVRISEDFPVPQEFQRGLAAEALTRYALRVSRDAATAESLLTRAIQLNPRHESAYHNRSEARIAQGNFQGGLEDCDQVIRLNPKAADAYLTRSAAKAGLQDFAGAAADADTSLQLGIKLPIAYYNRGMCLLYSGQEERGRADLERFLELAPMDERVESVRATLRMMDEFGGNQS